MAGFRLLIDDRTFDSMTIASGGVPPGIAEIPQFHTAWAFCKAWLAGQNTFELQTSGSTGAPKRISYRREQLLASARSAGKFLGYTAGQPSLLCLNAGFVGGVMVLARGIHNGMPVTVIEPTSQAIPGLPAHHPYLHVSLSPIQLREALARGACQLSLFNTVLVGGADIDPGLLKDVSLVQGPRIYQTFGMTETLSHFALRHLNAPKPEPWYTVLPGIEIGQSPSGELVVNWPGVTDGPVSTHDLVEMVSSTQFIWKGRTDFTVNSGGIKIQPELVEAVAKAILAELTDKPQDMVLIGVPDAALGQRAVLVLEGHPLNEEQSQRLMIGLKVALPKYHAPKGVYFLPEFARTPTGKPNRRVIAEALNLIS